MKVERWIAYDDQGLVYGHPCQAEVDVNGGSDALLMRRPSIGRLVA